MSRTSHVRVIAVVAITAVTALAAAVFADTSQATRVANDGRIYTEAQRVGSAVNAVKGNLGITVVLVSASTSDVAVSDDIDDAVDRVRSDLDSLAARVQSLQALTTSGATPELVDGARRSVEDVLTLLAEASTSEDAATAEQLARTFAVPALDEIAAEATTTANAAQARIDAEGSRAGDAARASSLVVALIVPAVAIWSVFSANRRREERLKLRARLDQSLALVKARDELIAGISHQLRTPLTAISGYAQAMLEYPDDRPFLLEGLEVVEGQAAELSRMIDDMVTMARLEDGPVELRTEQVDVVREIETVLASSTAWERVQTSLSPAIVWADRFRLRHIVTNLVSNATTHGGGTVLVRSAPVEGVYRIAVADDGDGLPSERIESIFEPYVHTPKDALLKGTLGLGLAVAKRLASQMGCELSYERMNGYTLFILDVPTASPNQLPAGDEVVSTT
jgi:signal transduction histidine kinase